MEILQDHEILVSQNISHRNSKNLVTAKIACSNNKVAGNSSLPYNSQLR